MSTSHLYAWIPRKFLDKGTLKPFLWSMGGLSVPFFFGAPSRTSAFYVSRDGEEI